MLRASRPLRTLFLPTMSDRSRRHLITLASTWALAPTLSWAAPRGQRPLAQGPRVSADPSVTDSGLGARWQAAMAKDLGWSAPFTPVESAQVLDLLEQGQTDVGLFLSHPKADGLEKQGLIYERHTLARTDALLVGPTADPAGIHNETDAGLALAQVLAAAGAGQALWLAPAAGSALASLADTLTHGLASKGLPPSTGAHPSAGPAYQLVSRAALTKGLPAGTKIWPLTDPRLALDLQMALSFRSRHPASKLLVNWLQSPLAQGMVGKAQPAWRRPQT